MAYSAVFSRKARKAFLDLPQKEAQRIQAAILEMEEQPRRPGTIKLESAPVGEYRHRVGNYRIIFDIDDANQILEVVDIRKRDDQTYR